MSEYILISHKIYWDLTRSILICRDIWHLTCHDMPWHLTCHDMPWHLTIDIPWHFIYKERKKVGGKYFKIQSANLEVRRDKKYTALNFTFKTWDYCPLLSIAVHCWALLSIVVYCCPFDIQKMGLLSIVVHHIFILRQNVCVGACLGQSKISAVLPASLMPLLDNVIALQNWP